MLLEKGRTEDETVGWHHQLDRQESEQALGVGDGQGSLAHLSGRAELSIPSCVCPTSSLSIHPWLDIRFAHPTLNFLF